MNAGEVESAIQPHLEASSVNVGGKPERCQVVDWANRDDELELMFSDMFGDGSPDGFEIEDGDTLVPFAILGMSRGDGDPGQPEGVLFVDTASGGAIVRVDVDGTAIVSTRSVVAPSLAALDWT